MHCTSHSASFGLVRRLPCRENCEAVRGFGARLAYRGNRIRFTPYGGVGNKANS
jgi:hypothetical protein